MQLAKSVSLGSCFVLAFAGSALAQQATQLGLAAPPEQGIYAAAVAGSSFGPPRATTLAVEYGEHIHRNVQAYATLTYFENLMRQDMRDDLSLLSSTLSTVTGTTWDLQGRDRGVAFIVGAKYLVRTGDTVQPYLGPGAGAIGIKRKITEPRVGNVTAAVLTDFGLGELSLTTTGLTRPIVEAAAGVGIAAGRTYVDIGYRYRRAFHMTGPYDFSQLAVGIGMRF